MRIHIKVAILKISLLLKLMHKPNRCEVPLYIPLTEKMTRKDLLKSILNKQGTFRNAHQPQIYTTKTTAIIIRMTKVEQIVTQVRIDTKLMVQTLIISVRNDLALALIVKTTQVKLQSLRKRSKRKVSQHQKQSIANRNYQTKTQIRSNHPTKYHLLEELFSSKQLKIEQIRIKDLKSRFYSKLQLLRVKVVLSLEVIFKQHQINKLSTRNEARDSQVSRAD